MDRAITESIKQVFSASQQGKIHFAQVIAALSAAGVESYLGGLHSQTNHLSFKQ